MADETTAVSPEGQEAAQPDDTALEDYQFQDEEPVEESAAEPVEEVADEPIPLELTVSELVAQEVEKAFQRIATRDGRRDKELLGAVENMISQRIPLPRPAPMDTASILDDPDAWVAERIQQLAPQVLHNEINRATLAERNYTTSVFQHVGQVMDCTPAFKDKTLGAEVVEEFQKISGNINKSLPPDVGGELLLARAYMTVMGRRNTKGNALSGNNGIKGGVGGVKSSATSPLAKAKPLKLSPDVQRLAKIWDYKEEDLQRVFKDA